jgi:hypothetical protein
MKTCSNLHGISPSCLIQVVLMIRSSVWIVSLLHSRYDSFLFLQWSVTTMRPRSNGILTPVASLISISTVWKRLSTRGQYCTGSKTLVTISASIPYTGTNLNSSTWASPTILGSTSGQYTYREFAPLVTSATWSPCGNIACLNPNMCCKRGLMVTLQSFFTAFPILCSISFIPMSNFFLSGVLCFFPSMAFNIHFGEDFLMLYQLCGYCISASPISHDPSKSIIWGSLVVKWVSVLSGK